MEDLKQLVKLFLVALPVVAILWAFVVAMFVY